MIVASGRMGMIEWRWAGRGDDAWFGQRLGRNECFGCGVLRLLLVGVFVEWSYLVIDTCSG